MIYADVRLLSQKWYIQKFKKHPSTADTTQTIFSDAIIGMSDVNNAQSIPFV